MIAYELYWLDEKGEYHLLGLLPERRTDPNRITQESIMNWGGIILGDTLHLNNLFFIQVEL
ncbi:MAG: hypothetical protein ACE144_12545 [Thermodesulfobacteriota bacterium]